MCPAARPAAAATGLLSGPAAASGSGCRRTGLVGWRGKAQEPEPRIIATSPGRAGGLQNRCQDLSGRMDWGRSSIAARHRVIAAPKPLRLRAAGRSMVARRPQVPRHHHCRGRGGNDRNQRVFVVAGRSREGPDVARAQRRAGSPLAMTSRSRVWAPSIPPLTGASSIA